MGRWAGGEVDGWGGGAVGGWGGEAVGGWGGSQLQSPGPAASPKSTSKSEAAKLAIKSFESTIEAWHLKAATSSASSCPLEWIVIVPRASTESVDGCMLEKLTADVTSIQLASPALE